MSFSQTNTIRMKKKQAKDSLVELPKTISLVKNLIDDTFNLFDQIGKNIVNLAMFDIDPSILDKFDQDFKRYSVKKSEISSILSDVERISSLLKDTEGLFSSEGGSSALNESVIGDLQTVLGNINETIGSDINTKLEELKVLKQELETINNEVKQPVEQINESLQLFQKTSDVSFEIFTKSMLESLKNSVEMKSMTENLEDQLYDLPVNVTNSVKDEIRSAVNEAMVNMDVKIQKVLEEKLKDIKLMITSELSNSMDAKFNQIMDKIQVLQTVPSTKTVQEDVPQNRDMREINMFLKYLYTMPTSKDEILKKIEDFRDTLLVKRSDDPPFRVTATNVFRESISEISREDRHISENKMREVIQLFENLKRVIE